MQSVLKTLNVMKWLPVEAETMPEKQLREDLVKKKKESQLSTLCSPHPFKARRGSFYLCSIFHAQCKLSVRCGRKSRSTGSEHSTEQLKDVLKELKGKSVMTDLLTLTAMLSHYGNPWKGHLS